MKTNKVFIISYIRFSKLFISLLILEIRDKLALIKVPDLHDPISKKKTHSSVGFDFISFVGNNKKALAAGRTLRDIWIFCCDSGRSKSEKKILTNIPFLVAVRYAEIAIDQK